MNPVIKSEWIAALRAGNHPQGFRLLNEDGRFCYLGVLCDIATQHGIGYWWGRRYVLDGTISFFLPPPSVAEWAGFDPADFGNPRINGRAMSGWRVSFAEMAGLIERWL